MTIEEAKGEMPNIDYFLAVACGECTGNDWYCPKHCDVLEKAKKSKILERQLETTISDEVYEEIRKIIEN